GSSAPRRGQAAGSRTGWTTGGPPTMRVPNPPPAGAFAGEDEAVEIVVTRPQATLLAGIIFNGSITQKTRAVASVRVQGTACILALSTTASSAVKIWGSTYVETKGCVIGSNSTPSNTTHTSPPPSPP